MITIDEVPAEYKSEVETIVANKIAAWGPYKGRPVTAYELKHMIEEVL